MSPETSIESSRVSAAEGDPSGAGSVVVEVGAAGEEAAGPPQAAMRAAPITSSREMSIT